MTDLDQQIRDYLDDPPTTPRATEALLAVLDYANQQLPSVAAGIQLTIADQLGLTQQPTELAEVPGISPAEFEAFKTRWEEGHVTIDGRATAVAAGLTEPASIARLADALGGVTVEEAGRNYETNKHPLQSGAINFRAAIAYFDDLTAGYAPGVEQRVAELPDATGTLQGHVTDHGYHVLRYGTWKTCDDATCTDCADYLADQHAGTNDHTDGRSP